MKMRLDYEKIYNARENNPNFESDIFGIFNKWHIEGKFGKSFNKNIEKIYFEQFPRRKKFNLNKALKDLPNETIQEIRKKWQDIAMSYFDHKIKQYKLLNDLLDKIADNTEISPTKYKRVLKNCHISAYSSQGWGAHKYARNSVSRELYLLDKFNGKVVCFKNTYYLVANIEKWQFDALKKKDNTSILQWAVNCWKSGVNPRVYNPFLPYSIVDKSIKIHMEGYKK
jgi:hypothetical protein